MEHLTIILSFIVLVIATAFDIKSKKIPNWLTMPTLLVGIAVVSFQQQDEVIPLVFFAVVFIVLAWCRVIGWGDAKCIIAVAALNSWLVALTMFVLSQIGLLPSMLLHLTHKANGSCRVSAVKVALAPYLLCGYIITVILFAFINYQIGVVLL